MPRHADNGGGAGVSGRAERPPEATGPAALAARFASGVGKYLYRGRRVVLALLAAAAIAFIASLRGADSGNATSLLTLITVVWLSFLLAYGHLMARGLPAAPPSGSGVLTRIAWRLRLLVGWCLIVFMAVLACALGLLTLRALTVIGG